jgi:hypothetical protein
MTDGRNLPHRGTRGGVMCITLRGGGPCGYGHWLASRDGAAPLRTSGHPWRTYAEHKEAVAWGGGVPG